jgi:peptide/nickel transport system substrate-binding protein
MRQLLSLMAISMLALLATACGRPAASTPAVVHRGEFRVLIPARPTSLNPNLALDEVAGVLGRSLFNQLITLNETGRLLPELAESWTVSPDGLRYTFKLRRGVRWHDGAALTSADVRWTLETAARDGFAGTGALAPVASIATPDDLTVVITLKHAWAPFATDLAGPGLSILPEHVYEGADWRNHPANHRPVGTGPFRFARWANDDTLVLDANDQYFRGGPYVERLIFEAVSADHITDKLTSGEADYSVTRPILDWSQPPPVPLAIRTLPTSARLYVAMNLRRSPFGDVRVRRALASAVDRLEIVSDALGGVGAPAVGWYTPDVEWAYNHSARVPAFDLDEARRLLDAAGLRMKGGERFRASIVAPNTSPMREVADLLRQQFAAIGVTLTVERVSPGEWPARTVGRHDFDLTIVSGGQGPDPDQLRRRFLAATDTGAYIGYADSDFAEAVERGARVVDVAARAEAYHRAQEILARDVPFIPLAESAKIIVYNRRVSGLPQLEARSLVGAFDFSLVKVTGTRAASAR